MEVMPETSEVRPDLTAGAAAAPPSGTSPAFFSSQETLPPKEVGSGREDVAGGGGVGVAGVVEKEEAPKGRAGEGGGGGGVGGCVGDGGGIQPDPFDQALTELLLHVSDRTDAFEVISNRTWSEEDEQLTPPPQVLGPTRSPRPLSPEQQRSELEEAENVNGFERDALQPTETGGGGRRGRGLQGVRVASMEEEEAVEEEKGGQGEVLPEWPEVRPDRTTGAGAAPPSEYPVFSFSQETLFPPEVGGWEGGYERGRRGESDDVSRGGGGD